MDFNELFQSADWKTEKHSPVIEIKEKEDKDFVFVKVLVGKEIAHPNQTNHHIALKTGKSGTLIAFSYCNIHGLWRSEQKLSV